MPITGTAGAQETQRPYRIDVHHHFFPPQMIAAQRDARAEGLGASVLAWSAAKSLDPPRHPGQSKDASSL